MNPSGKLLLSFPHLLSFHKFLVPELAATSTSKVTSTNQHLPCRASLSLLTPNSVEILIFTAPNDQLRTALVFYFNLGMSDGDIANSVMDHFDPACYGLRCVFRLVLMS